MTTNRQAANILHEGITTLLLAYDGASGEEREIIRYTVKKLKEEYNTVLHRTPASSYSEVTGGLSKAADRLSKIAEDRENLANTLVSAAAILEIVTRLLDLIAK